MFEQTLIPVGKTKRPVAVVVAFAFQMVGVGVMLVIPTLFVESLPMQEFVRILVAPTPPPPPPPPPIPAPAVKVTRPPRQFNANVLLAPRSIPKEVADIKEDELPPSSVAGVVGGVPGGVPGGVMGGVIGGIVAAVAAPAPPPPVEKAAPRKPDVPQQVRVSGAIQAGMLARQIQPDYPLLARRARIEGTVVLKAIIARDGRVEQLTLISGQPLLVEAAMNAVRQWLYKPTYLNGEPVEVITEVDVNFHLQSQ